MDTNQRKELLHLRIEQANEEMQIVLSKMVEALFQTYQPEVIEKEWADEEIMAIPAPKWANKKTVENRNKDLLAADAECERGEFVTLESLQSELESW